ncbi:homocysteine S-methyltransferase family protein [Marinomonas algicola]|uniref:homocysteine S-methyltransferase family protein n=1 Tax=Marinomonas algicola TaxID=2773454 RepID=UPI001749A29C|nr:homocysteine S-methyltransferase family protein [Marinomonas algicola]
MTKLTLLDGGMGRELKRVGAPFSQPLWSAQALIEAPHYVTQAHTRFIDAGADIITVNSYACVPFHLGDTLYQQRGAELAEAAAVLAKQAVKSTSKDIPIAGSLPPALGSYRPDLFEADRAFDILTTLFTAQNAHVDLWIAETISSINEALTVSRVFEKTNKPCYYAFTLNDEISRPSALRSGELVTHAIEAILEKKIDGIFFNCSIPEVIEQALIETNKVLEKHQISFTTGAFANSFTPISSVNQAANLNIQSSRDLTPEEYIAYVKKWHHLGASIIGGCCGIGPEHIEAMAQWRNKLGEN